MTAVLNILAEIPWVLDPEDLAVRAHVARSLSASSSLNTARSFEYIVKGMGDRVQDVASLINYSLPAAEQPHRLRPCSSVESFLVRFLLILTADTSADSWTSSASPAAGRIEYCSYGCLSGTAHQNPSRELRHVADVRHWLSFVSYDPLRHRRIRVQRTSHITIGECVFSVTVAKVWINLPSSITSFSSLLGFWLSHKNRASGFKRSVAEEQLL